MAAKAATPQSNDIPISDTNTGLESPTNMDDSESGDRQKSGEQNGSSNVERTVDRYGFFGGRQYTEPDSEPKTPIEVIRQRELKWIDMLENWEKWMSKRFKKVKERCRKGIPPSIRGRAWQYLSGSKFLLEQNKGLFQQYLKLPGDEVCVSDILKDVNRQYPLHEIFSSENGLGQEDLFAVLKAYSIHNPKDGYCQAMAPIAAILLMHMPAEQAFWCFVSICDKYLPGYYSDGLDAVQVDGEVLYGLLKKVSPITHKHLMKYKVEPQLVMVEWFMCVYTRNLPWPAVLRVWDMFMCEGVKVMFRVALVLLKGALGLPDQVSKCSGMQETLAAIRHSERNIKDEDILISECLRLPVSERDLEREHQVQLAKWKITKQAQNELLEEKRRIYKAQKKNAVKSSTSPTES